MITLHHLEHSRSIRILWALEELEVGYTLKYYRRRPDMAAPKELKQIHPLGKAPILTDEQRVIAESAVILDYLQRKYDDKQLFKPSDEDNLNWYAYWMHYAEGSLMPYLVFTLVTEQLKGKSVPFIARPLTTVVAKQLQQQFSIPRLKEHIVFLEEYLAKSAYFAGEHFSFADIQMVFPLQGLLASWNKPEDLPMIRAYVERVCQRPAYLRACEKSPDGGRII